MHIAFDGGCFQQGILGGIYQVACGFLNAAKLENPNLKVTLICDPRQGSVRQEALDGVNWQLNVIYASVVRSYDPPEVWPSVSDPNVRFFVDGKIIAAKLNDNTAKFIGDHPARSFAILSRSAPPTSPDLLSDPRPRGIKIEQVTISNEHETVTIAGYDRRLAVGFLEDGNASRWTDGAGFIPLNLFPRGSNPVMIEVKYKPQDNYIMKPGIGSNAILKARERRRDAERENLLVALGGRLKREGCVAYIANHFTPITAPGLVNAAWAYDLIPVLFPQYFHADAQLNFKENLKIFSKADRVYSISECTRNDLIANSSISPAQVITAGIAPSIAFKPVDADTIQKVTSPLGLRRDQYILAVATIEPRKNHLRILQAYLDLRKNIVECPDLLIVGNMGWDFQKVLSFRFENNLEEKVKIISDRSEDDLVALYSGALFSIYLSVYEGFGLPIIEAMACDCPVLTSDRSSMPEVADGAALLVNPYDIDAIVAAMLELSTNKDLRTRLKRRGSARSKDYTWTKSSKIVIKDLIKLTANS